MENYIETRKVGVNIWGPAKYFKSIIDGYEALANKYGFSYQSKVIFSIPFLYKKMQFVFVNNVTEKYAMKFRNEIADFTNQCFGNNENVVRII